MLKAVWLSAYARNHVICLRCPKCLITLVHFSTMSICRIVLQKLSIYTVAFTAIFRNICTAQYTTRIDPHADNVHQVWSWYDHTLPSYSVFVCWYVTWRFDLDYWPFVLEQLSYMVGHVTNPATKFEDPTTIRSWVTSYNASHWLLLKMRARPLRMRRITWPASIGSKNYIFGIPDPDLPIHYTTFIGFLRRLRVVYSRAVQC